MFDGLMGARQLDKEKLTGPEAFAGILVAIADADGDLSDEEAGVLINSLTSMRLFANYGPDERSRLYDKLFTISRKRGAAALMASAIPACPPDLREAVFTRAVDMVLSDGVVEDVERKLLSQLKSALQIPDELSNMIIKVIQLKYKG